MSQGSSNSENHDFKSGFEHHEHQPIKATTKILKDIEEGIHKTERKLPTILESEDGNYVYIDNKKLLKQDLMKAFGGYMNPGWSVPTVHKFGNPAPLGLSAFAYCTFVASLINMDTRGVINDNVNTGAALFYGGMIQMIAGLWEFSLENAFGGLAFCSFGGYWFSSASMNIPWFNSSASYTTQHELNNAMGFFYLGWLLFTIVLLACTLKSTFLFFLLFLLVFLRLLLLTIFRFYDLHSCEVAAGVVGVIVSLLAWYHAYAGLATKQNSYYVVDPLPMPVISKRGIHRSSEDQEETEMHEYLE